MIAEMVIVLSGASFRKQYRKPILFQVYSFCHGFFYLWYFFELYWGRESLNSPSLFKHSNHQGISMKPVQQRLVELLSASAATCRVQDVRIGLGYTVVQLDSGEAGVACTPRSSQASCTHLQAAGSFAGSRASELLTMLEYEALLARALGLATANALLAKAPASDGTRTEILDLLHITEQDHVVMVGYFAPLLGRLKKSGCRLDIVELNPDRAAGTLPPEEGKQALEVCSVAIITGTSLINATFAGVEAALGFPRAAVLLGPSSPLCPEAFEHTKITHVAGSRVTHPQELLQVVSEGGGTRLMKPYVDFLTISIPVVTGNDAGKNEKKGFCSGEQCTLQMCK